MTALKRVLYAILQKKRQKALKFCGKNVNLGKGTFSGHIEIGSNVSIGSSALFVSTRAKLITHDDVVFAPNVTIYTGDHITNYVGKHIIDVSDEDKARSQSSWDKDVIIESGCWIGTGVIILKGVTVGRGSVIGAGSVVTHDVDPYSIVGGVPAKTLKKRFQPDEIIEHEKLLRKSGKEPDSFTA